MHVFTPAYNSVSRADMDAQNIILVYSKGKAPVDCMEQGYAIY